MNDETVTAHFIDERNITFGKGRVIWAKPAHPTGGERCPEGWVLPGGRRTTNLAQAHEVAIAIDKMARA